MSEETNSTIAVLLEKQTYDERVEMAGWIANVAIDAGRELTLDDIATWLGAWAEMIIDEEAE